MHLPHISMHRITFGRRTPLGVGTFVLLAGGLLAGCEGGNGFGDGVLDPQPNPGGSPVEAVTDTVPPSEAKIVLPVPDAIMAVGDPLAVRVSARDNLALDSVVVEGFALTGGSGSRITRFERGVRRYEETDTVRGDTAALVLRPQGSGAADPVYLVATVFDRAGNANADTTTVSLAVIRGTVIPLENTVDQLVDLASDGERVFLTNFSRNRVEVLSVANDARSSFRVGSQPWGMAISPDSGTLYVANSGGTNISVIDLRAPTLAENEARRIQTPNVRLFQVPFSRDSVEVVQPDGSKRKISAVVPSSVTIFDYSDRPQFIAQTSGGEILYSTKPTGSAPNGTIRRRRRDGEIELFLDYARTDQPNSLVIVGARDASLLEGDPNRLAVVTKEGEYLQGFVDQVEDSLRARGSETFFDYFRNLDDLGLQDTTFVAVSGDHRSVAFGEGAMDPGRVMLYTETSSGPLVRSGDTGDLVNNASERIIGLALNQDGTLGAARGREAYFFSPNLRLQGVGVTGAPSGGIALHPDHRGYPGTSTATRLAFVSGVDDNGSPFVDVLDSFSFFRLQRIFLRQPVTGALLAVRPPMGSGALVRLYAVTASGVLRLDVTPADVRQP